MEAVRHIRAINREIRILAGLPMEEITSFAKANGLPYELALKVKELGRLPVVNFAAGGIATPADAALMMQFGCDGIFVGSGIFKSTNPEARARAIVKRQLILMIRQRFWMRQEQLVMPCRDWKSPKFRKYSCLLEGDGEKKRILQKI